MSDLPRLTVSTANLGASAGGRNGYRSGYYYAPAIVASVASVAINQSRLNAVPFPVGPAGGRFDRIATNCISTAASSFIRMGIYADSGYGDPGALFLDAGQLETSATTGIREITIDVSLAPGMWWLVSAAQGGSPTMTCYNGINSIGIGGENSGAVTVNQLGYRVESVTGAMPASYGTPLATSSNIPKIMLRSV